VIASLNHALNYVVTAYATSLLDTTLGGVILGFAWSLNSVSGLTIATACVRRYGYKISMIISFAGYTFQIATLYVAVISSRSVAWPVAIIGCIVSGFTSAIWWTAQGVCFENTCKEIEKYYPTDPIIVPDRNSTSYNHKSNSTSDLDKFGISILSFGTENTEVKKAIRRIRANLSAHWTIIYQCADIIVFLSLSIIPLFGDISIPTVIAGLAVLGAVTTLLGFTFDTFGEESQSLPWNEIIEAIQAVPIHFQTDARATLIAPYVFGFGITSAMFAYYVNADIVSDSSNLGEVSLGFLEAWSYFVAVLSAFPYKYVSKSFDGGQDLVIQFGSLSFLLSGLVVLCLSNDELSTWTDILVVKALYGLGRGVFEGSCRAVYAQMFAGKDLSTAFSAQTLLAGMSGGICFFLFGVLSKTSIAAITVANGICAIVCYGVLVSGIIDSNQPVTWSQLMLGLKNSSIQLLRCCFCRRKEVSSKTDKEGFYYQPSLMHSPPSSPERKMLTISLLGNDESS